jgi:hypothetical protein
MAAPALIGGGIEGRKLVELANGYDPASSSDLDLLRPFSLLSMFSMFSMVNLSSL